MTRRVLSASLTILLSTASFAASPTPKQTATVLPSPSAAVSTSTTPHAESAAVDSLSPSDLNAAVQTIQARYFEPLDETALRRATVQGLLTRLGHGAVLFPNRSVANPPQPSSFYRDSIAGHIGYLRPGRYDKSELGQIDDALQNFAAKKLDAVVLDLRTGRETDDLTIVADFADRFIDKGEPLFGLRGPEFHPEKMITSNRAPSYSGLIIALIDRETSGVPEVIAGVLRAEAKAILIGEKTAGEAVQYSDVGLPSGKVLRVAVAQAVLPNRQPDLRDGLVPDLAVAMPEAEKHAIWQASLSNGIAPFVFEPDRPHLNEAALLAGTNPEIEAAQSFQRRRGEKAPLHDPVLQRAVDVVTSIDVFKQHSPHP